jgi:para-nitrobenzyl esterase
VRDASQFAPHCPQTASTFGRPSDTEDCLYLNVVAPARDREGDDDDRDDGSRGRHRHGLAPVMVWIHGGALVTGESDDYDPTRIVEQGDVVVVTINYRLGALGFLAHPALTAESPDHASGNYGLLDQQAALGWVQRNIARFGGDPRRVTIFGESAGGLSVHAQLASPPAHGLFHAAIVESGAYQLAQPSLATGEAAGAAFAAGAGCATQTAACLRGLTVAQVLATQAAGLGTATPVVDGKVLTLAVGAAFATGQFHHVPVIEGSNHDEFRLFVAGAELTSGPLPAIAYPAAIQGALGVPAALVPVLVAQYPLASFASPGLALSTLGTDAIFACNARFAAQQLSRFVPTFSYEFNDPDAPQPLLPPVSFPYGAYHGAEIEYLFTVPATVPVAPFDAAQQQLSTAMIDYWTSFARTGHPGTRATPTWAPYQTAIDGAQALIPGEPRPETGFAIDHRCAFWDAARSREPLTP